MIRSTILAAVAVFATASAALAQTVPAPAAKAPAPAATAAQPKHDDGAREKFRQACGGDIAKLCGDAKPVANATPDQMKEARGKLRACLATHKAQLSADCKTAVVVREAAAQAKKS